ncbi:MAG: DUF58 domain-containing protein [Deltaproteobacteria bacterium]|nr:DUF58 domain-containing protein [Deltaproteobacteria bacterium]
MSGNMPDKMPDETSGKTSGKTSGEMSGKMSGKTSGETSGKTSGKMSGETSGTTSGETSGTTSGETSGTTSGEMNARRNARMSETMTAGSGRTTSLARAARLISLVVPAALAAFVTLRVRPDHLLHAMAPALVTLWVVMLGALAMRFVENRRAEAGAPTPWDHVDVLTASGASTLWLAAAALLGGAVIGWASLSVLGVLGMALVFLAVTWIVFVAGGGEPWRRATIERRILPDNAGAGDPLREELRLVDVKIPPGTRLFATGRATKRGPITRYAVGAEASGADVRLESALGPAERGEHVAPPLALWFGDLLGLARTPSLRRGEVAFTVLPRPAAVGEVQHLLGRSGDDAARPAQQLPTDGSFRIREYVPGDDTRRIHWVRSAQRDQLVVRLPDELPHTEPALRLVLDDEMSEAVAGWSTHAPDELLDALVAVWLGVGKALAERGTHVTLATAVPRNGTPALTERVMQARPSREVLRLGARVAWQGALPVGSMLDAAPGVRQIVVSYRPRWLDAGAEVVWIVVPVDAWTRPEPWTQVKTPMTLPYPMGSPENRLGRRAADRRRIHGMLRDRAELSRRACSDWRADRGSYVAKPEDGCVQLTVIS